MCLLSDAEDDNHSAEACESSFALKKTAADDAELLEQLSLAAGDETVFNASSFGPAMLESSPALPLTQQDGSDDAGSELLPCRLAKRSNKRMLFLYFTMTYCAFKTRLHLNTMFI